MERHHRCRWLPRLLLLSGALYAFLLVGWHARQMTVVMQSGGLRTRRPRLGEELVLPEPTHAWTPPPRKPRGRTTAKKRVVLSPQGRAAIRRGTHHEQQVKGQENQETPGQKQQEKQEQEQEKLKQQEEQEKLKQVKLLSNRAKQRREWRCIGWRATGDCSAQGPREPERDATCAKLVDADESGYCELEDKDTGERVAVLRRACNSLRPGAVFRCSDAWAFVDFPLQAAQTVQHARASGLTLPGVKNDVAKPDVRDGIVMVVYPKLLASAYATLRALREVLHCQLPVEIWYTPSELQRFPAALEPLRELAEQPGMGIITFREVNEPTAKGFRTKVFAIYHSNLERVLFLDADNVPTRDPIYLFESDEFQDSGAVFWPDFWHPGHTIFNIQPQSLLWELLDMPFANMFEQESGQLLIDRRRHAAPLELVRFYAFHQPNLLDKMMLVHGDKDLFRLAWLKLNQRFHMVQTPPAVAGKVIGDSFCGMTMVQHDLNGEVLFFHRNSHKLTGRNSILNLDLQALAVEQAAMKLAKISSGGRTEPTASEIQDELDAMAEATSNALESSESDKFPDPVIWTHLLSFRSSSHRADYVIETYTATPEFPESQHCYGQRSLKDSKHFVVKEIVELGFSELETQLRRFALEEAQLHQKKLDVFQGNQ